MNYLTRLAAEIRSRVDPDLVPDGSDDLFLSYALLVRAKGIRTTASDVHDAWAVWMLARDAAHESIAAYDELPSEVRREDEPFLRAIHAVARETRTDR